MKKYALKIVIFLSIVYSSLALEVKIPQFDFSLLVAKPPAAQQVNITQSSSVTFRLLQGERFYSDLALSVHISDLLRFFHPSPQNRSFGQFAFFNFSLNFPRLGGRPISLAFFTGQHTSLAGTQYCFDFLKHKITPVRMTECDISSCFLPPEQSERIGVSLAGLTGNSGYLGASFGWNTHIKEQQEYGIYMQGGAFSNSTLMNSFLSCHISDKAKKISLSAALSMLFSIHENFSIYTQAGLSKTDVRSSSLKTDIIQNIFVFFEPRVHLQRFSCDFTFFASSIRERNHDKFFPTAPLLKPFTFKYNDLFGGLNTFFGFGNIELDKMQGGFHILTAVNINQPNKLDALVFAVTPFFTVDIGSCDFDIRAAIFPLVYATPTSMFEGKITIKRDL